MPLKEKLMFNKILRCWNMTQWICLLPSRVHVDLDTRLKGWQITHRWSWRISLNLNRTFCLFSFFFFAQGKGCGLILGTPWLLSAGVTAGMLFKSNFFYLKVFMWADKALSLYPKVPCSTLVLQITLTYAGAATLRTGNQLSPPFSAWSFIVDNGDVCVMLLTDLRMQSIKRLKGISSSNCRNLLFFWCSFIYLRWGEEWDSSNLYLLLSSDLKPKFKSQKVSSHSSHHS